MNKILYSKTHRRKLVTCVISFVFFLEGMMFYNHHSYAYHVEQAQDNVKRLEGILEGKVSEKPLGASLLGIYEPTDDFGDIKLRNLTGKIVNSTEYAIENADDIKITTKLKTAIDEIAGVQEKQVSVIHSAIAKIEADDISQEVTKTYEKAVDLKEKVAVATEEIELALENGQEYIDINILTDKEDSHGNGHDGDTERNATDGAPHSNPNLERIMHQKEEDAAQREVNRKRIRLIEEGRDAHKAQQLKNKLTKANNPH